MGVNPSQSPSILPEAFVYGNRPQAGAPVTEVAVMQVIIRVGDDVPLPLYADGTQAGENEVFWTAAIWRATFRLCSNNGNIGHYSSGDNVTIHFSGRRLASASGVIVSWFWTDLCAMSGFPLLDLQVLVTIVASRAPLPTPIARPTIGQLKAKYATPGTGTAK